MVGAEVVALPALIQLADRDGTIAHRDATIDALSQELDTADVRLESRQETIESLRAETSNCVLHFLTPSPPRTVLAPLRSGRSSAVARPQASDVR